MPSPTPTVLSDQLTRRVLLSVTLQDIHGERASTAVAINYPGWGSNAPDAAQLEFAAAGLANVIASASNAALVSWALTIEHELPQQVIVPATAAEYATTNTVVNLLTTTSGAPGFNPFRVALTIPAPAQGLLGPLGTEDVINITPTGQFETGGANAVLTGLNQWVGVFSPADDVAAASIGSLTALRGTIGSRKARYGRRPLRSPVVGD